MKFYVAYGSNLDEGIMGRRCPSAVLIGTGTLHGYRLLFKGELPSSYATVEEWEGYEVPVLVWKLTAEDEKRLDCYEGYPHIYGKREVEVELDGGEKIIGMIYVKPEDERLNPPCDHYYAVLYNAYEKFGFNLKSLEESLLYSDVGTRLFTLGRIGDEDA